MVCQFYLSFQRTSFWLCWFLVWSLLFLLHLFLLIFKIYFLLQTLRFFISSFSRCFRCRVRLFIWLFSCFLRYACIAMTFPLSTGFTMCHRFWVVVFSFHSFLFIFWFLFWSLLQFVGYSAACCLASICWNF